MNRFDNSLSALAKNIEVKLSVRGDGTIGCRVYPSVTPFVERFDRSVKTFWGDIDRKGKDFLVVGAVVHKESRFSYKAKRVLSPLLILSIVGAVAAAIFLTCPMSHLFLLLLQVLKSMKGTLSFLSTVLQQL